MTNFAVTRRTLTLLQNNLNDLQKHYDMLLAELNNIESVVAKYREQFDKPMPENTAAVIKAIIQDLEDQCEYYKSRCNDE